MSNLKKKLVKAGLTVQSQGGKKYSDLSHTAQKVAQQDYLDGWLETHPEEKNDVDLEWAHDMLTDLDAEHLYSPRGNLIG